MDGMAKSEVRVDSVTIAPSISFFGDVASFQQVGDYLSSRPLRNTNGTSQFPSSYPGVVSDIAQHQSVVAKKCPLRHVSPPFDKFL
jgi:hypothetical protein